MDLDLVFLGTAASAPTAARGTAATLVRRGGDRLLVDCGEGTQRQLLRSDVGLVDLEQVFLTHLHSDHVLAHVWLNLAAARTKGAAHEDNIRLRDAVANKLSLGQLSDARYLAGLWFPKPER